AVVALTSYRVYPVAEIIAHYQSGTTTQRTLLVISVAAAHVHMHLGFVTATPNEVPGAVALLAGTVLCGISGNAPLAAAGVACRPKFLVVHRIELPIAPVALTCRTFQPVNSGFCVHALLLLCASQPFASCLGQRPVKCCPANAVTGCDGPRRFVILDQLPGI